MLAIMSVAKRVEPRRRRWCSTRWTPASAAKPPASSASGCGGWASAGRCCASPTCRRSPRSAARHFSIVKDTSAEPTRATVLELDEGDVVGELVRMLGADSDDSAARRHARRAAPGSLSARAKARCTRLAVIRRCGPLTLESVAATRSSARGAILRPARTPGAVAGWRCRPGARSPGRCGRAGAQSCS